MGVCVCAFSPFLWRSKGGFPSLAGGKVITPVTPGGAAKLCAFSEPFQRFIFLSVSAGGQQ